MTPLSSFSLNRTKQTPQKDYTPLSSSILSNTLNGVVSWVSLFCLKCDFSEAKGKFDCKHTSFDIRVFKPYRILNVKSLKSPNQPSVNLLSNQPILLLFHLFSLFILFSLVVYFRSKGRKCDKVLDGRMLQNMKKLI